MDKNAITVKDVVELALIELQYMAADFSQRREFYVRSFGTGRFRYTIIKHSNGYGCNRVRSRGYTNSIRSIRTSTRPPLPRGDVASPDYRPPFPPHNRQLLPLRLRPQRVNEPWDVHAAPSQDAAPASPVRNGRVTFRSFSCSPRRSSSDMLRRHRLVMSAKTKHHRCSSAILMMACDRLPVRFFLDDQIILQV